MDKHDTVGIDCVAMCVNDIICCGAKPLFFLDYIAIGKNVPEKVAPPSSPAWRRAACSPAARSSAARPPSTPAPCPPTTTTWRASPWAWSTAPKIIDHNRMRPGDVADRAYLQRYPLQRLFPGAQGVRTSSTRTSARYVDELGCTLGEELLRPTKIYVKPVLAAMDAADVHGVSHITGGGFYENIPRCIPDGLCAKIDKSALRTPPIFGMLQRMGSIPEHDMFNTYNMGVGMTMIVAKDDADKVLAALKENGQDAYVIGEVVSGEEKVALC